jgi:hypothetical protein
MVKKWTIGGKEIDVSTVEKPEDLQLLLARSLDFPNWCGCNWNAFGDAIKGLVEMPCRLRLVGWTTLAAQLRDDVKWLRQRLDEIATQYPMLVAEVEYAESQP